MATKISTLTAQARKLRAEYLPNAPGGNDLDAACKALNEACRSFPRTERVWRTAQLADGNIVGQFAESEDESILSLTFWWGHDVVWITEDADSSIDKRYYSQVPSSHKESARWAVTEAPLDNPYPLGTTIPESVEVSLFDLIDF